MNGLISSRGAASNVDDRGMSQSMRSTRPRHRLRLRHPLEVPLYVVLAILNLIVVVAALRLLIVVNWLPFQLQNPGWTNAVRGVIIAGLLVIPGIVVGREVSRAATRGTALQLSRAQYPELYATMTGYAQTLGLGRIPDLYLANGNGALNAFAAQAFGHEFIVVANELFANLRRESQAGLRFILGHELGHIKLHHVSLWYQLSLCYTSWIPLLGAWLSRLREYSCDRHGAYLCPDGEVGLVLLTSGRYTEQQVNIPQLLDQGRQLHGFWIELAQLPRTHPWTVRRLDTLYRLALFKDGGRQELAAPAPTVSQESDRR
jgi:Zn-dependent protease with chaperone function